MDEEEWSEHKYVPGAGNKKIKSSVLYIFCLRYL